MAAQSARRDPGGHMQMRTLIYKRTHSGDPDEHTGVFGCYDCMGPVRGWAYDAVIGVGGVGPEPTRKRIAGKLTWVGIGPQKVGRARRGPQMAFEHFWYLGERGPLLKDLAPELADHMLVRQNIRVLIDKFSPKEQREIDEILKRAKRKKPSPALLLPGNDTNVLHQRTLCPHPPCGCK
jgi:hypothetical protein